MEKKKVRLISGVAIVIALASVLYSASVLAEDNGEQAKKEQAAADGAVKPLEKLEMDTEKPPTQEEMNAKKAAVAKEWGIDISGLNDEQIDAALQAEKLKQHIEQGTSSNNGSVQDLAKKLGIDTEGLSDEQIKQAIDASGKEDSQRKNARLDKNTMTPEQYHQHLIEIASEIGITVTGLNDDQIEDALRAEKMKHRD